MPKNSLGAAYNNSQIKEIAQDVLTLEADAIMEMSGTISTEFCEAVKLLSKVKGRIIVSGMGKSGHVGRKFAATLASTGSPAQFVHPGEASHGDLGMVTKSDAVILMSNSGETKELADIIGHCKRFGITLVGITKTKESTLGRQSDVVLLLPQAKEACAIGMAPTTSTTCTLALSDALAVTMMKINGFSKNKFLIFHPGGKLGAELIPTASIMHTGEMLPSVDKSTKMSDVLLEMTSKGFGVTAVTECNKLIGIITDGDLRRNMQGLLEKTAGEVATYNPLTTLEGRLAVEGLHLMNKHEVTSLFIVNENHELKGLIQIHDCLRIGLS